MALAGGKGLRPAAAAACLRSPEAPLIRLPHTEQAPMSDVSLPQAVIRAEPDGYDMAKPGLMGRQSAGNGFLRAAIKARGDQPIFGYSSTLPSARGFQAIIKGIEPEARFEWVSPNNLDYISKVGALYLADITVATHSRLRLRTGAASYSLCGVTHTTASLGAMDEIAALLREPVMSWDALVCTSTAVVDTVKRIHDAQRELHQWQFGAPYPNEGPMLPVIPLGAHWQDYDFDADTRARARQALDIADDEVVGLFVGRLVFHAKAHPYPMFRGMQLAAERTGKRLVLILSGWSPNEAVDKAFREGAAQFAPDVRTIIVDGRDPTLRTHAWAASDLFVSLSDNIQETFGLTPIEAMAAGLPVVVSDWDGYRDTVRHEVDGFRVRTYTPGDGMGLALIRGHEAQSLTYDQYCWAAASTIAVDIPETADAIARLVENPDLRRRMGEAGRLRARTVYDWDVIFRQYQELWAELAARRQSALSDPRLKAWIDAAPKASPARLDPFDAFGHYPSATLTRDTRVAAAPHANPADLEAAMQHVLFGSLTFDLKTAQALLAIYQTAETTIGQAATATNAPLAPTARATGFLLKLGLVVVR